MIIVKDKKKELPEQGHLDIHLAKFLEKSIHLKKNEIKSLSVSYLGPIFTNYMETKNIELSLKKLKISRLEGFINPFMIS